VNFSIRNYVYVAKTGGYAEKKKNEKEPGFCPKPFVKLPADKNADDYGNDNGNTHARDHAKGLKQISFILIHQA